MLQSLYEEQEDAAAAQELQQAAAGSGGGGATPHPTIAGSVASALTDSGGVSSGAAQHAAGVFSGGGSGWGGGQNGHFVGNGNGVGNGGGGSTGGGSALAPAWRNASLAEGLPPLRSPATWARSASGSGRSSLPLTTSSVSAGSRGAVGSMQGDAGPAPPPASGGAKIMPPALLSSHADVAAGGAKAGPLPGNASEVMPPAWGEVTMPPGLPSNFGDAGLAQPPAWGGSSEMMPLALPSNFDNAANALHYSDGGSLRPTHDGLFSGSTAWVAAQPHHSFLPHGQQQPQQQPSWPPPAEPPPRSAPVGVRRWGTSPQATGGVGERQVSSEMAFLGTSPGGGSADSGGSGGLPL